MSHRSPLVSEPRTPALVSEPVVAALVSTPVVAALVSENNTVVPGGGHSKWNFANALRMSAVRLLRMAGCTLTQALLHQCQDLVRNSIAVCIAGRNICNRCMLPNTTRSSLLKTLPGAAKRENCEVRCSNQCNQQLPRTP